MTFAITAASINNNNTAAHWFYLIVSLPLVISK